MQQYLNTLQLIKDEGVFKGDRTGTGTQSYFGMQQRYSLRNNQLPVVTTKKIHLKSVIHELIWMLSGNTNVDYLIANGVRIWNEWVKPETAVYRDLTPTEIETAVKKFVSAPYHVNFHADPDRPGAVIYHPNDYVEATGCTPPILDEGYELILDVNTHCYGKYRESVAGLDMADQFLGILYRMLIGEPKKLVSGELGPVYGKVFRDIDDTRIIPKFDWVDYEERGFNFVVDIPGTSLETDRCVVTRKIDQVADLIEQLEHNPDSRRLMVSLWDPRVVDEQALPPCHYVHQFWTRELTLEERIKDPRVPYLATFKEYSTEGYAKQLHERIDGYGVPRRAISCMLTMRSVDGMLGLPFNITFYSLLTHLLANQLNMVAEEFIWSGGDCHIYNNHQDQTDLQLTREPYQVPTISFRPEAIGKDIRDITIDDFTIDNYESHPHIAGKVAV